MDLRRHVLRLGDEEMPLRCPRVRPRSTCCMEGISEVVAAQCYRVMMVWLEGLLEAANSLTGMGSRAAHQAEVRTLVQPSSEVPVRMTRGLQLQKQTEGGMPAKGPCRLGWAALRRKQLENTAGQDEHTEGAVRQATEDLNTQRGDPGDG
jgi:hypothetical protein